MVNTKSSNLFLIDIKYLLVKKKTNLFTVGNLIYTSISLYLEQTIVFYNATQCFKYYLSLEKYKIITDLYISVSQPKVHNFLQL